MKKIHVHTYDPTSKEDDNLIEEFDVELTEDYGDYEQYTFERCSLTWEVRVPKVQTFKILCPDHNCEVSGRPEVVHEPTGSWIVDTSDMSCPGYRETDKYGCWNNWQTVFSS